MKKISLTAAVLVGNLFKLNENSLVSVIVNCSKNSSSLNTVRERRDLIVFVEKCHGFVSTSSPFKRSLLQRGAYSSISMFEHILVPPGDTFVSYHGNVVVFLKTQKFRVPPLTDRGSDPAHARRPRSQWNFRSPARPCPPKRTEFPSIGQLANS